jgi:hypothetical protein
MGRRSPGFLSGPDRVIHDFVLAAREILNYVEPPPDAAQFAVGVSAAKSPVDLDEGWATLSEKGGRVHVVALPNPYLALLLELIRAGEVTPSAEADVVPMAREQRRSGNRDDRVIWRIVKDTGKRAGVPQVFPRALRHAFSVRFLEQHPGEIEALQWLLGHARMETTQRYLRAMEHQRLLDRVRDLSWDTRFEDKPLKARTGFEPVYEALQASA